MNTTTAISSQVRDTFNFGIIKAPLVGPDNMVTPHFGLFRNDTFECVGNAVKDGYEPHTTDDVCALVEAAEFAFDMEVNVTCHFNEGHHVLITPTKDYRRSIYGDHDNIFPRFGISMGYNGTAAQTWLGMFRDACLNLARLKSVDQFNSRISHTKSLRGKMDALITNFQSLRDNWEMAGNLMAKMQANEISLAAFLIKVYGEPSDSKRGKTMHVERTEEIVRRVAAERYATGRPKLEATNHIVSVYEAYNAVQGYTQHCVNRRGENASNMSRILLAANDPNVLVAEKFALSLVS